MYIVNAGPGFKKVLWPAAQKFLDPKTTAKIHVKDMNWRLIFSFLFCFFRIAASTVLAIYLQVLDAKSLGKLLEVIDPRLNSLLCFPLKCFKNKTI